MYVAQVDKRCPMIIQRSETSVLMAVDKGERVHA